MHNPLLFLIRLHQSVFLIYEILRLAMWGFQTSLGQWNLIWSDYIICLLIFDFTNKFQFNFRSQFLSIQHPLSFFGLKMLLLKWTGYKSRMAADEHFKIFGEQLETTFGDCQFPP